jgi:hypothetical protein
MVKVPYKFYRQNIWTIQGLLLLILAVNFTIGYFVKSYYDFPEIQCVEVVFFTSILLHFALVQIIFRKRIKDFNEAESKKKTATP